MPDLPILNSAKIIKILKSKGFILDRTKGSHHIYYQPETNKRVVVPFHSAINIAQRCEITNQIIEYFIEDVLILNNLWA